MNNTSNSNGKRVASYGSWKSPISSDLIVQSAVRLQHLYLFPTRQGANVLYWLEMRPQEQGRCVLVMQRPSDGSLVEINPKHSGINMRTTVHEYGGAPVLIDQQNSTVYYSNFLDQRVYKYKFNETDNSNGVPDPLTPEGYRFADGVLDERRGLLFYVREDHTSNAKEPVNTIASVDIVTGKQRVMAQGADFYSSPRLSADGNQLCYVQWNHPNMPWDNTELYTVDLDAEGNAIENTRRKVAGNGDESVMKPLYSPNGVLYFVTDRREGWWNIHRLVNDQIECVCPLNFETGGPQWTFGHQPYHFVDEDQILLQYGEGLGKLGLWSLSAKKLIPIETGYTHSGSDDFALSLDRRTLYFIAGSPTKPTSIVMMDIVSGNTKVLKKSTSVDIDEGYLSVPEIVEFPTSNHLTAYGFFYRPKNKDYVAPDNEKPPLLVKIHGGPTAGASASLRLELQYGTSRGFAIMDVNYGGSTGYGRAYRHRLYNGNWGIVDVDDCCNAAQYLVKKGEVDPKKLCIDGGSAGGYTTLACLVFRDVFSAGASHYGVCDLEALAHDTHKFESRYLENLLGKYPEEKQKYYERSPIHFTDRLNKPIAIFHGDQDKIVPPNQAEMFYKAVLNKGIPVTYLLFEGEQHGFRKSENIKKALDGEFYFYTKVFGIEAPDISPIPVQNFHQ
jgi:dipeptidyl aminopeptidase/acylaminoacyl peptidase